MIHPSSLGIRVTWLNVLRFVVPSALLVLCCYVLWQRIAVMDIDAIGTAVAQVTMTQWALAAMATWCSFQAIGHYDALGHRYLRTGTNPQAARRAGIRAVAVAQTLGFGALTGSLVRWRCLPAMSLWQVTRLSIVVTLGFTACWAVFAVIAIWWLDVGPANTGLSLPVLLTIIGAAATVLALGRKRFAPQLCLGDIGAMLSTSALDMLFAAIALYVLIPDGVDLPFATLAAAYVVALGVGLISNAPGGAGVFDLVLLSLLPVASPEPLVAGIVAFRIVYYLLPAGLALLAIARPPAPEALCKSHAAAWGLSQQSGAVQSVGGVHVMLANVPFLSATIGPHAQGVPINALRRHAHLRGTTVACYNADPRMALMAKRQGWHVKRTAMEAIIRPARWGTTGSARQSLRRKLKQAERAGVSIEQITHPLQLPQLQIIARNWALAHGGELGFSMGRFCPDYIQKQQIFLIKVAEQTAGFITFHHNEKEWSLDLIRHNPGLPDGAMHAAIVAAINAAKTAGAHRLSLATVPDPRYTPAIWANRRAGLIQFKRSFRPIWVPRYHIAPTAISFWFSAIIIALAVHRPIANAPWKIATKLKFIMQKYQSKQAS